MRERHRTHRSLLTAAVPPVAGWRTYPRTFLNSLLFALAALMGEWVVHQTEYLIEYGNRFGAAMASTPHRFYMAPLGVLLTFLGVALCVSIVLILKVARLRVERLISHLPARVARSIELPAFDLPLQAVQRTAIALVICQSMLYLIQENAESVITGMGLPGAAVLFAPQHITVLPLHALAALCGSVLLWMASAALHRSRTRTCVASAIARIFARRRIEIRAGAPSALHLPDLRLVAGVLCLRSPPVSA